jgi:hypothetical protein
MTRTISLTAALAILVVGSAGSAMADPHKDESGKGRGRGGYERFERGDFWGDDERRPRARRAFKEEYDDGICKVERKLEPSGDYKEERKCRGGYPSYGYRR